MFLSNPYKMAYHIEPGIGLINDPNGLIQFQGKYYFFHQWNRFNTDHSYKEWGLFTSTDMIHWKSQGSAILPDRQQDRNGVYSGSAIEHEGEMFVFYTGNVKNDGVRKSYQCISKSSNGQTFVKEDTFIETPPEFTEHFRDPKVWRGNEHWWMVVGAQTKERRGAVALFSSENLTDWTYERILYDQQLDNMCECPDLFSLHDQIDILVCCPQSIPEAGVHVAEITSYAGYLSGHFNETTKQFEPASTLIRMDSGFDFYAPQTFVDEQGRRIMVGWMSRMSDEEERLCPTKEYGYLHSLTLPRVLSWEHGTLKQRPIQELDQLRKGIRTYTSAHGEFELESGRFEMGLQRSTDSQSEFRISLRNGAVEIYYCDKTNRLTVSRMNWVTHEKESREAEVSLLTDLRMFSDNSSLEIFVNDGELVFSLRYFTEKANVQVSYAGLKMDDQLNYYPI